MAPHLTSPVMVGRATELARLEALLTESRSGARFITVTGDAGIGKSRLLAEFAAIARRQGFAVHAGGCPARSDGPPIAFAAFTQALRSIVRSVDARSLDVLLGPGRGELARLLPELGSAPEPTVTSDTPGTARLYEAVLILLERLASPQGLVLVLEDLQWADVSSRTLLAYLHRNLGPAPVLIAASLRTDALAADDPILELLRELGRSPVGEQLPLGPLTSTDARAMLLGITDVAGPKDRASAILRRSGGVPLYVEELAATAPGSSDPPVSVRSAVERRMGRLTREGRQAVGLVALSGGSTDTRLIEAASGVAGDRLDDALREAIGYHLLVPAARDHRQVAVRHILVGEAIVAGLLPGEAERLHRMLAVALESRPEWGGETGLEQASRLAGHLLAIGEDLRAVPAIIRAADSERLALAFADAHQAYQLALAIVGDGPSPLPADDWVRVLGNAAATARLVGAADLAVTIQVRLIACVDATADTEAASMARAGLARYLAEAGRSGEAQDVLEAASRSVTTDAGRLRIAMEHLRILVLIGAHAAAAEQARVAIALATSVGAGRDVALASAALGVALSMDGRHAEALAALADSRRIAPGTVSSATVTRPSRFLDSLLGYADRATVLARAGDGDAASMVALDGLAAAQRMGLGAGWGHALAALAARERIRQGRWLDAEQALDAADAQGPGGSLGMLLRAILATRRGQLAAAADGLALLALADLEAGPGAGWVALFAQAMGELDLARSHLGPARAAVAGGLLTADLERDPSQRAEIAALGLRIEADSATLARDHRDRATLDDCERAAMTFHAQARSDLAVGVARDSSMTRVSWASVLDARLDGELARVRGDVDPDPWRRAIAVADQSSDDPARAYARLRLAECLLDHGRGRAEAIVVLRECRALAEPLAAALILDPVARLVERARLDVDGDRGRPDADPVPGPRSAARRLGLSDREVDVLELLAQGMTDREIATHLFITEKTAGHHVSHILDKLAVARRGEAAALAHRLGLLGPATSAAEEGKR